ncbi:class I SAM-dependent methyltransferase [Aurantibacter crassamenti]|uniref:class I SAM-dependent methyltransferase n=1 Tax=Aurantibacter crassamenti TaxID=1837375 RepID=UPI001939B34B|nr:class I SAM-dependent methyltransferase [Aurantibacter crassamenti]MBM1106408.1 class I SAM-dependent methyltransferase [Aurantibacter crassamenti]
MDYDNKADDYYKHGRPEMLAYLPEGCKTILDIGCGEGSFANHIKEKENLEAWGIELMQDPGKEAEKKLDKVFIGPCENFIEELPDNYFDAIYCNDVLEHLVDPYTVLSILRTKLTDRGVVISSIPNIRYHDAFKKIILQKKFEYEGHGIFDKTHLRFFTKSSIAKMYEDLGYQIVSHEGVNRTRSLKPYLYNIPFFFTAMDMFYLQFATVAKRA